MRGRQWTDTELDTFHRMRLAGASAAEIGAAIGRSEDAVRRMTVTMRVKPPTPPKARSFQRKLTPTELSKVRDMFAAKASRMDLGRFLNIEPNSVSLLCQFNGIGDEYTAAMRARKSRKGVVSDRVDITDKQWRRMCIEGSSKLRDAVLALYRRERERKAA